MIGHLAEGIKVTDRGSQEYFEWFTRMLVLLSKTNKLKLIKLTCIKGAMWSPLAATSGQKQTVLCQHIEYGVLKYA